MEAKSGGSSVMQRHVQELTGHSVCSLSRKYVNSTQTNSFLQQYHDKLLQFIDNIKTQNTLRWQRSTATRRSVLSVFWANIKSSLSPHNEHNDNQDDKTRGWQLKCLLLTGTIARDVPRVRRGGTRHTRWTRPGMQQREEPGLGPRWRGRQRRGRQGPGPGPGLLLPLWMYRDVGDTRHSAAAVCGSGDTRSPDIHIFKLRSKSFFFV